MRNRAYHHVLDFIDLPLDRLVIAVEDVAGLVKHLAYPHAEFKVNFLSLEVHDSQAYCKV